MTNIKAFKNILVAIYMSKLDWKCNKSEIAIRTKFHNL